MYDKFVCFRPSRLWRKTGNVNLTTLSNEHRANKVCNYVNIGIQYFYKKKTS